MSTSTFLRLCSRAPRTTMLPATSVENLDVMALAEVARQPVLEAFLQGVVVEMLPDVVLHLVDRPVSLLDALVDAQEMKPATRTDGLADRSRLEREHDLL